MNRITIVDNLWAIAEAQDDDIDRLLRFRPKGYQFAPSYKKYLELKGDGLRGGWDGFISLVRHKRVKPIREINYEPQENYLACYFPAGLVPYVMSQPWASTYQLDDLRVKPRLNTLFSDKQLIQLDPHQERAVSAAISSEQGIVKYPTGTGKGRIIGETIRRIGGRAVVLVDKVDLIDQLGAEIEIALGTQINRFGGRWARWDGAGDCTIATYQTLSSWLESGNVAFDLLRKADSLLVDEAHHTEAKTYQEVMQNIPAFYRLGFSATPFKSFVGKKEDLGTFLKVQAWLGPPAAELTLSEGVDTGRIVPADLFIIHGCEWNHALPTYGNYREEVEYGIVKNIDRNEVVIRLAKKLMRKGPTVILVERLEHGELLHNVTGIPFIHGSTEDRKAMYDDFRDGHTSALIISKIGDEALDLPTVRYLILAGGGRADHRQTQRIGRGQRSSNGKAEVMVFDFEDYGKYISAHYRRRRRLYENEPAYTVVDVEASEV